MAFAAPKSSGLLKKYVLSKVVLCGFSAIGLCSYTRHTLWLKYYKNQICLHGNLEPVEPSERLKNMLNEVLEDFKGSVSEYTPITPFIIPGLNPMHAGTIGTFEGGIIGLPIFFEFINKEDVSSKVEIKPKDDNIIGNGKEDSYDSFLLSDEAKKYAIAREVLFVNTIKGYVEPLLPTGIAFIFVAIFENLAVHIEKLRLPLPMKFCYYTAGTILAIVIWRFLHINLNHYYESKVESSICKLGDKYIKGGIEYCSKAIERNSLPVELKDQNVSILQLIGDCICSLFLLEEIPLSHRVEVLKANLKLQILLLFNPPSANITLRYVSGPFCSAT